MSGTARVKHVVRRLGPRTAARGGFDRVHDGLVSGWFSCTLCGSSPKQPVLLIDGKSVDAAGGATQRDDAPTGLGFVFRFAPTGLTDVRVQVRCPNHANGRMEITSEANDWRVSVLGAIEATTWPMVTGWLAFLDPADRFAQLLCEGREPLTVGITAARSDVEAHLGTRGVGGFQIDLSRSIANGTQKAARTALLNGTTIRLAFADRVLAVGVLEGSPLGDATSPCLSWPGTGSIGEELVVQLRSRFIAADIDTSGDWRDISARAGIGTFVDDVEQWASYLRQHGDARQVAAWLGIQAASDLASQVLNPLPASLHEAITAGTSRVPAPVTGWARQLLGLDLGDPHKPHPARHSPRRAVSKVAVSGLIHHPSGLGQNARNSLDVLAHAGIHGCSAPFYPNPGGWNPQLSATPETVGSLEDHAILLHLPIDSVIPGLAAQPALLRSELLIGYFMWETAYIPRRFVRALSVVDEIWTASRFVADNLRSVTDTPVHVTGHLVRSAHAARLKRADLGIPEDAFVVHYAFDANSTVARKNPCGAIDAFHRAFEGDPAAVFLLKVRNMQQVVGLAGKGDRHAQELLRRLENDRSVRLVAGEHDHAFALGLIDLADCYLSMHRSEGYGYGIAEAMALGTPVIATGYSGSTDLTVGDTAWLVPFDEVEVLPGQYFHWEPGMTWASPNVSAAAALLQRVREGSVPDVEAARRHIEQVASLDALGARYASVLAECPPVDLSRSVTDFPG